MDIVARLGTVQKAEDKIDARRHRRYAFAVSGVGAQVEQNVLLRLLVVKVALPVLYGVGSQLLPQEAVKLRGEGGVHSVDVAVIGTLRLQEGGGQHRVRGEAGGDPLVLNDDVVRREDGVAPLTAQPRRVLRRVADGGGIQSGAGGHGLIGSVQIPGGRCGVGDGDAVLTMQHLRGGGLRRPHDLGLPVKAVVVEPVEGVRIGGERGVGLGEPAAAVVDLPHEAAQVVGAGLGHGDAKHGILALAARSRRGQIAVGESGIVVGAAAYLLHRAGEVLLEGRERRGTRRVAEGGQHYGGGQKEQGGAAPYADGGGAAAPAEANGVQQEQHQRAQHQLPRGGCR